MSELNICDFCYHMCRIAPGQTGFCGTRMNTGEKIETIGYGKVLSAAVDPIEKKPFYHLFPGEKTLSIALFGCNYHCDFCQNSEVSQPDGFYSPANEHRAGLSSIPYVSPEGIVDLMRRKGLNTMCYTYSDPVVWQDYMLDTARLVKESGGYNLMVTNGSFSKVSLERVLPFIDGFNIDVKGDEEFYRQVCQGSLKPVLDSVGRICADPESVVEVTTLIIEGFHTEEMVRELGKQLYDRGVKVWHLSRFFPHYRMENRASTSEVYLQKMLEVADESGIPHIYAGNSINLQHEKTICPECGHTLIGSHSYRGESRFDVQKHIRDNRCIHCGEQIYGFFT